MNPIWIVDDDRSIRWVLEKSLSRAGWPWRSFASADDALAALESNVPQLLISDIRMPGADGLELLRVLKTRHPHVPVIVMTAYSDLDSAVSSFQGGAFDYLAKPFDVDEALQLIARALNHHEPAPEGPNGEARPGLDAALATGMLGQAPAMQALFRAIGRLSTSNATVLITGESGSGKELVARALHRHSARADRPFVALNTAAIAGELLESELFGHERGAFTGAHARRAGRFEEADGGTLFLDEIGDMPGELQTRLLRVLGDGSFYRVGGTTAVKVNVRVIAATHQKLEELVQQGRFREDLFHRLNVIRLRLPPLRERAEDIPLLAQHFLQTSARNLGIEPKVMSAEALSVLTRCQFPGNVRQLENVCQWLSVMVPSRVIAVTDLPADLQAISASFNNTGFTVAGQDQWPEAVAQKQGASHAASNMPGASAPVDLRWLQGLEDLALERLRAGDQNILHDMSRDFERTLIRAALRATGGRRVEAAQRLGLGRNTITRKMRELGME